MARRLQDVLGEQATLARYGGDEFIAVMPHVFRKDVTDTMLQRILDELSKGILVSLFASPHECKGSGRI